MVDYDEEIYLIIIEQALSTMDELLKENKNKKGAKSDK